MKRQIRFSIFFNFIWIIFWVVVGTISPRAQVSAPGWTPPRKPQSVERRLAPSDLVRRGQAPMIRLHPEIRVEPAPLRSLPSLSPAGMRQERKSQRLRIGAIRTLGDPIDTLAEMTAFTATSGDSASGRLHIARIVSKDALSVRLHFTNVALPKGARLFVYALNNFDNFHGPYENNGPNGDGEFWTPPVAGDSVVIEYFAPDAASEGMAAPFRVAQLSHAFIDERVAVPSVMPQQGPGACNNAVPATWSEAAKSVARLRFVEPQGEFLCTGTLLNTTDNSGKPYILTANHCFSAQSAANSLVATWLYDAGDDPSTVPGLPASYGSYLVATGARSDFTLVELRFPVPNGVRFSGWTTAMPAPGTPVASIHHPFGSYKRFSSGAALDTNCPPDFPGLSCNDLIKTQWSSGITEPGSSGGPLFVGNPSDPRLAGTLLGGSSACDNRNGVDYFSRFDLTFEAIRFYLTGSGCAYELSAPERLIEASGGARSVGVFLREGDACAWTASSTAPWIKITGAASGKSDGQINYDIEPNQSAQTRYGFLIIADQTLAIAQPGAGNNCAPTPISPGQPVNGSLSNSDCRSVIDESVYADRYTFSGKAGQGITISLRSTQFDGFLTLINSAGEIIAQNDDAPFYGGARIPAGGPFVLPADGVYTVEATSVDANAVGGYTLELNLTGCVHAAALETTSVGHFGGFGQIVVRTEGGGSCNWPVGANNSWLSPPSVSFAGTVPPVYNGSFFVGRHTGEAPRTGVMNVAGFPLTVTQHAACGPARPATLSATNLNLSGYGGRFTLQVTTTPGRVCSWEARGGSDNGISVESGFSGVGDGEIKFSYQANSTLNTRMTTLDIAGQKVTLRQEPAGGVCQARAIDVGQTVNGALAAGDCGSPQQPGDFADHFSFNAVERQQVAIQVKANGFAPAVYLFDPRGTSYGVVYNPPGQTETELRLPSVGYSDLYLAGKYTIVVTSRDGGRVGDYTISLTGIGGPGCGFILANPETGRVPPEGGEFSANLTAQAGCQWMTTSAVPWITFQQPSGSGGGAIKFQIAPNTGPPRRGTASVANRFFDVYQYAPCSYVETYPDKIRADARGGRIHISLKTGRNCPWNAASKSDWITLGNVHREEEGGSAMFDYTANPGALRVGAVEIAGRIFEVRQGGNDLTTVSAASFAPVIAPGSIAAVFGAELTESVEAATRLPLPDVLAGSQVSILHPTNGGVYGYGQLFFASPGQINFYIPDTIPIANGIVSVGNYNGMRSYGPLRVERVAPALFSANANGQGVAAAVALRVKADGSQTYEPIAVFDQAQNRFVTRPIDLGSMDDQIFLILFGTGARNLSSLSAASAQIGGAPAEVLFVGTQGGFVGLDQVNLRLPRSLAGRGEVDVVLTVDGKSANTVKINVK